MEELIKDIKDWMLRQYSYPIGPIDGISAIELRQPAFLKNGWEQIIIR